MDCRGFAEATARVEERNSGKREVWACPDSYFVGAESERLCRAEGASFARWRSCEIFRGPY
jgi:hypothetical protein